MFILRIWNYLKGYAELSVSGYFLEKFINICIRKNIYLWGLYKESEKEVILKVRINGFKKLRPVARKTGCRVKIIKKRGLPFILNRYRKRKTFIFGAVFFFCILSFLTSFIWSIEITGNKSIDYEDIMQQLNAIGIRQGVLKYRIDPADAVNRIILNYKSIAWAGASIKGTKFKVYVTERVIPPELIPIDEPCNIVAAKDGIIESITVKNGKEEVRIGETVERGQILVSGIIQNRNNQNESKLVHSIACIKARTWYENNCRVETYLNEKIYTGNISKKYYIILFMKKINLPFFNNNYENYDKIESRKTINLGDDFVLPFEFISEQYIEFINIEKQLEIEEAKELAAEKAYENVLRLMPENVQMVDNNLRYIEVNGVLCANIVIECIEDIGIIERIGGY